MDRSDAEDLLDVCKGMGGGHITRQRAELHTAVVFERAVEKICGLRGFDFQCHSLRRTLVHDFSVQFLHQVAERLIIDFEGLRLNHDDFIDPSRPPQALL